MPYAVQGAAVAPITTGVFSPGQLRRLLIAVMAVALALTLIAVEAPTPAQAGSDSARVVSYSKSHLGKRFRLGTEGLRYFDCSGLVWRVYAQAGLLKKIGGSRMRAASYFKWFRQRGLISQGNPRVGDVIWWTKRGRIVHTGLYIGNGQAVSALINPYGVMKHSVKGIHVRFLAYGHTRLAN